MKIFGIGLNKTGTVSLHVALETLGFKSLHWGGPDVRRLVERAVDDGRPLVEDLPDYQAYSDIWALSTNFAMLDEQYPGSRFILTTREVDGWIESRRRHVARNRKRHAAGLYDGTFLEVDEPAWRDLYLAHHARVEKYFAGRDDLLVMRIAGGDGYDTLCPFLGVPLPDSAFPTRNRSSRWRDDVSGRVTRPGR